MRSEQVSVSASELELKRRQAEALSEGLDLEPGWSVDFEIGKRVVELFPRLQVQPGLRLVSLFGRERSGGNGWTYAIPEDSRPTLATFQAGDSLTHEPPQHALPHVMEGIEGDGSLDSYLDASVLYRELLELGAWWHGIDWRTHKLLDGKDEPDSLSPLSWKEDQSIDRSPTTTRKESELSVTFWTLTPLGQERVIRHTDTYKEGSLRLASSTEKTLATSAARIVF